MWIATMTNQLNIYVPVYRNKKIGHMHFARYVSNKLTPEPD